MPTIGNNKFTLLHTLSDYWLRFFKEREQLEAIYSGSELELAQIYLDTLTSFVNISINDCPLFSKQFFKLITVREDELKYRVGANVARDRYVHTLIEAVASANILQNKVYDPTASLEQDAGYEYDTTNYEFNFEQDVAGQVGRSIGWANDASFLTHGTLGEVYSVSYTPFATAKVGDWVAVSNSASGNNHTYVIAEIIDSTRAVLSPKTTGLVTAPITTPDPNNGFLEIRVLDSEFHPLDGYAYRQLSVLLGGVFDDAGARNYDSELRSWCASAPQGLGIRKGDVLRVLTRKVPDPLVPGSYKGVPDLREYDISLVRNARLFLSADTPIVETFSIYEYAILRKPLVDEVKGEALSFTQSSPTPPVATGEISASAVIFSDPSATFVPEDTRSFITATGCGPIVVPGTMSYGVFTPSLASPFANPFVKAFAGGTVTLVPTSGDPLGQAEYTGHKYIADVISSTSIRLVGTYTYANIGVTLTLDGVTNDGTYKIQEYVDAHTVKVDPSFPFVYPDANTGSISWVKHLGYTSTISHTFLKTGSVNVRASIGDMYTGGTHLVEEGVDYKVNYNTGDVVQIGKFAGTWGVVFPVPVDYQWWEQVFWIDPAGGNSTPVLYNQEAERETLVNEIAFWAPDVLVDKYNLYQNFGYLINRFQPSSETYRQFIRGVFQLYMLGPTMERMESAFNIIAGFPVIRDDGEVFVDHSVDVALSTQTVTTRRTTGLTTQYVFPYSSDPNHQVKLTDKALGLVSGVITFHAFEPLTTMFRVVDYTNDPTWWHDITIPTTLWPGEPLSRRMSLPTVFDNIVGPLDDCRIGDPGFYVGADDSGVVPEYGMLYPAFRHNVAYNVLNYFLKYNLFHVQIDNNLRNLFSSSFFQDLQELVLVAKPGYKSLYLEPTVSFLDSCNLSEYALQIKSTRIFAENIRAELPLVVGDDWVIGNVFNAYDPTSGLFNFVPSTLLLVAPGGTVPDPVAIVGRGISTVRIENSAHENLVQGRDYVLSYSYDLLNEQITTTVQPISIWPAETYNIEYSYYITKSAASKDLSKGDTDYMIGGQSPLPVYSQFVVCEGAFDAQGIFQGTTALLSAALHTGQAVYLEVLDGNGGVTAAGVYTILTVLSSSRMRLDTGGAFTNVSARWRFFRNTFNGQLALTGLSWWLTTGSFIFGREHVGSKILITDVAHPENDGYWEFIWPVSEQVGPFPYSRIHVVPPAGAAPVASTTLTAQVLTNAEMTYLAEKPVQIAQRIVVP